MKPSIAKSVIVSDQNDQKENMPNRLVRYSKAPKSKSKKNEFSSPEKQKSLNSEVKSSINILSTHFCEETSVTISHDERQYNLNESSTSSEYSIEEQSACNKSSQRNEFDSESKETSAGSVNSVSDENCLQANLFEISGESATGKNQTTKFENNLIKCRDEVSTKSIDLEEVKSYRVAKTNIVRLENSLNTNSNASGSARAFDDTAKKTAINIEEITKANFELKHSNQVEKLLFQLSSKVRENSTLSSKIFRLENELHRLKERLNFYETEKKVHDENLEIFRDAISTMKMKNLGSNIKASYNAKEIAYEPKSLKSETDSNLKISDITSEKKDKKNCQFALKLLMKSIFRFLVMTALFSSAILQISSNYAIDQTFLEQVKDFEIVVNEASSYHFAFDREKKSNFGVFDSYNSILFYNALNTSKDTSNQYALNGAHLQGSNSVPSLIHEVKLNNIFQDIAVNTKKKISSVKSFFSNSFKNVPIQFKLKSKFWRIVLHSLNIVLASIGGYNWSLILRQLVA
jgi:hypothetical protein